MALSAKLPAISPMMTNGAMRSSSPICACLEKTQTEMRSPIIKIGSNMPMAVLFGKTTVSRTADALPSAGSPVLAIPVNIAHVSSAM